jgi:hypothetical protein
VKISGVVNITAGTSTTAVVLKVRQGAGITGTQVGVNMTHTLAAGASASIPYEVEDTTVTNVQGQQYSVTATQTGGAANGTANIATITCQGTTVTD